MWDPAVYRRFGGERSRPFFDLVARVGARAPRAVTDLGCGSGELTRTLAGRWPRARLSGVDSSPEMIAKAVAHGGPAAFTLGDVRDWRPEPDVDVLVANASLQWVPEHRELLSRWARELVPGAWLAVQVPGSFGAPSHVTLRELARRYGISDMTREAPVDDAAGYATLLLGTGATVDAWETTYVHLLPDGGDHPVLRWLEGTALRPVKAALDEDAWRDFRADLARGLAAAYPAVGGHVVFPFRRIFVVARTAARKASLSAGEPSETRTPSPGKVRTSTPAAAHREANSAAAGPRPSHRKLAWLSVTSQPAASSPARTRRRSAMVCSTRANTCCLSRTAASAAACATTLTE